MPLASESDLQHFRRMVRKKWIATVALALLAGTSVSAGATQEAYPAYLDSLYRGTVPVITPAEVGRFLDENPDALFLDVRSAEERTVSYIEGSELTEYEVFDAAAFESLPRDRPIIAYCAVGYRSERVGERLIEMGFTDLQNLYGGIIEWHNQGFPLVRGSSPPVHGYRPRWGKYVADGNVVYEPPVR